MELSWPELEQVTGVAGLARVRFGSEQDERRRSGRVGVSVAARAVLWCLTPGASLQPRVTRVREISATGASLLCEKKYAPALEQEVLAAIERRQTVAADLASPPLWVRCVVVRSEPVAEKRVVLGLKFLERASVADLPAGALPRKGGTRGSSGIAPEGGRGKMSGKQSTLQAPPDDLFRAAFEQSPVALALVGLHHRILHANRAFCQLTGYTLGELCDQTFENITHPEDMQLDAQLAQRLFTGELQSYEMEKRYVRKDGQAIVIHLIASLVRDEQGRIRCARATVSPVEARAPRAASLAALDAGGRSLTPSAIERIRQAS